LACGDFNSTPPDIYRGCRRRIESSGCLPEARSASTNLDHEQVHTSLRHAWATELLMAMTGRLTDQDELVRLANNWLAVQTYYVTYHATQAVAVSAGMTRPQQHAATQKLFCAMWADKPRGLAPWTLAVDAAGCRNVPPSVTLDPDVHPWSLCTASSAWSLAAKALRTTRDESVRDAVRVARENKKKAARKAWRAAEDVRLASGKRPRSTPQFPMPRLTTAERAVVSDKERAATLVDYLYRLRINTNYEDSAMFTDGPTAPAESTRVRRCFGILAGTTLLLCEMAIMRQLGKTQVVSWAEDWAHANVPDGVDAGIRPRLDVLREFRDAT